MDFVAKKDKIKDYLIISLIDTIIELYSYNYNIDKELVRSNLISKLEEMNILEIDLSLTFEFLLGPQSKVFHIFPNYY